MMELKSNPVTVDPNDQNHQISAGMGVLAGTAFCWGDRNPS
jgi:hypothetical protein